MHPLAEYLKHAKDGYAKTIGITGGGGSGKTTLATEILFSLTDSGHPCLVRDVQGNMYYPDRPYTIYLKADDYPEMRREWAGLTVFIDEVAMACVHNYQWVHSVMNNARPARINVVWTARRMADVPKFVPFATNELCVFQIPLDLDIKYVGGVIGDEYAELHRAKSGANPDGMPPYVYNQYKLY